MDHTCTDYVANANCRQEDNIAIVKKKHGYTLIYQTRVYICCRLQACKTNHKLEKSGNQTIFVRAPSTSMSTGIDTSGNVDRAIVSRTACKAWRLTTGKGSLESSTNRLAP